MIQASRISSFTPLSFPKDDDLEKRDSMKFIPHDQPRANGLTKIERSQKN
jgi:hypothetical protein